MLPVPRVGNKGGGFSPAKEYQQVFSSADHRSQFLCKALNRGGFLPFLTPKHMTGDLIQMSVF